MSTEQNAALNKIADAITPGNAMPYRDGEGGYVASLTEAVIGVGVAIKAVAQALDRIAEAMEVRDELP